MSYDEGLAERLREIMYVVPSSGGSARKAVPSKGGSMNLSVTEKNMFGGLCILVNGNMCCGIVDETLMARVGPDQYFQCLEVPHAREMNFTGKPLKGMVYVDPEGIAEDEDLRRWVERCLNFMKTLPPKYAGSTFSLHQAAFPLLRSGKRSL